MATIFTIEVDFNSSTKGFVFSGDLVCGVLGQRLNVPFTTNPADPPEIRIKKKTSPVPWNFKTISFQGSTASSLFLVGSWRTVTQNETFPLTIVDDSTMKLEVVSVDDDEIVIKDTNLATQIDIELSFQITIFDTTDGMWWTSPDPQIINEKESGG